MLIMIKYYYKIEIKIIFNKLHYIITKNLICKLILIVKNYKQTIYNNHKEELRIFKLNHYKDIPQKLLLM